MRTDGSGNILEFWHNGDQVQYASQITDLTEVDIDTTWTDVNLTLPAVSTMALTTFHGFYSTATGGDVSYRKNGSTGAGNQVFRITSTHTRPFSTVTVHTDASQKIEAVMGLSSNATLSIHTNGWYFPIGM